MTRHGLHAPGATPPITTLVTGMYWRKSLWNGAATVPVVLGFENARLTLEDTTRTVFSVPITAVSARLTGWRTLIITVDGIRYDFVGTGSAISNTFSAEQHEKLRRQSMSAPGALVQGGALASNAGIVVGQALGAGIGATAHVAGSGMMTVGFIIGAKAMSKWRDLLLQEGVFAAKV